MFIELGALSLFRFSSHTMSEYGCMSMQHSFLVASMLHLEIVNVHILLVETMYPTFFSLAKTHARPLSPSRTPL